MKIILTSWPPKRILEIPDHTLRTTDLIYILQFDKKGIALFLVLRIGYLKYCAEIGKSSVVLYILFSSLSTDKEDTNINQVGFKIVSLQL